MESRKRPSKLKWTKPRTNKRRGSETEDCRKSKWWWSRTRRRRRAHFFGVSCLGVFKLIFMLWNGCKVLRVSRPLYTSAPVASWRICIHRKLGNEHVELPTCYLLRKHLQCFTSRPNITVLYICSLVHACDPIIRTI